MTDLVKATDPARRMGVYKTLGDVPDRYRLHQHADAYAGRDIWAEWVADDDAHRSRSDWYLDSVETTERSWKGHQSDRGPHHALATPDDIETWIAELLADRNLRTVYEGYWARIESFYGWLQAHTDHPHVYHPALMAAADGEAARRVWDYKMDSFREQARQRAAEGRQ